MPGSQSATSHPDQDAPAERNTVLLLVIGGLVAISAVVAGLVIFTAGSGPARKPAAAAPVRAVDQSLVVGRTGAPTKVVIYEDFGSRESRELEIASRDFLRIEAARGAVQVQYRPYAATADGYSADAMAAWAGAVTGGTPKQALAFHDVLFDRQPSSGTPTPSQFASWAKRAGIDESHTFAALGQPDEAFIDAANQAARAAAGNAPRVLVDGAPVTGTSPIELADTLQRQVLRREAG